MVVALQLIAMFVNDRGWGSVVLAPGANTYTGNTENVSA
jgi:hypothetical protein